MWPHSRRLKHAINKSKQDNKYFIMRTLFATFKIYWIYSLSASLKRALDQFYSTLTAESSLMNKTMWW